MKHSKTAYKAFKRALLVSLLILPIKAHSGSFKSLHKPSNKKMSDVECLASAMQYEALGEGELGMKMVASVIFNRAKRSSKGVCEVVAENGQFSFVKHGAIPVATHHTATRLSHELMRLHNQKAPPDYSGGALFFFRKDRHSRLTRKLELVKVYKRHKFMKEKE